jgi:tRNA threonylcarbamoyladenosine biosynthesis protein TsaB
LPGDRLVAVKILAIENSSAPAGLAVAAEGKIKEVRSFDAPRGRGAQIFTLLDAMRPAWLGLDRIAIGIGPGSYNGLRTACALAGSFHLALGIEVVTAPSCCLLAVDDRDYAAIGDARGGRLWRAVVRDRRLQGDIVLLSPGELTQAEAGGPPATYRVGHVAGFDQWPSAVPDATVLALLAPDLSPVDPSRLEPLYLKPPHITAPRAAGV